MQMFTSFFSGPIFRTQRERWSVLQRNGMEKAATGPKICDKLRRSDIQHYSTNPFPLILKYINHGGCREFPHHWDHLYPFMGRLILG